MGCDPIIYIIILRVRKQMKEKESGKKEYKRKKKMTERNRVKEREWKKKRLSVKIITRMKGGEGSGTRLDSLSFI